MQPDGLPVHAGHEELRVGRRKLLGVEREDLVGRIHRLERLLARRDERAGLRRQRRFRANVERERVGHHAPHPIAKSVIVTSPKLPRSISGNGQIRVKRFPQPVDKPASAPGHLLNILWISAADP